MNPDDLLIADAPDDILDLLDLTPSDNLIRGEKVSNLPLGLPLPESELIDAPDMLDPAEPVLETLNDYALSAEQQRVIRMTQVVSKFSSTLALKPIRVELSLETYGDSPAWSDSETIYFQQGMLGDVTDPDNVTSIKGLTLHETAHIMLTPRDGSKLSKAVKAADLWRAFNALEDQRIEMYMTTRFGNTSDWLTATILRHIIAHPDQHSVAFPLIHGRKYLPAKLRAQVESMYEHQHHVTELRNLIDRYISLNLGNASKYDEAFKIIERYSELVDTLDRVNPTEPWAKQGWGRISDPNGHSHRKQGEWKSSSNKPMSKGEQEATMSKVANNVANGDDPQGDADGVGNSYELQDVDGKVDNDASSDTPSKGAGTGGSGELTRLAERMVEEIIRRNDGEIKKSIKQFADDGALSASPMAPPKRAQSGSYWYRTQKPSLDAVQAVKSFARELQQLKADHDPGWNRKVEQGRLNVQRYATGVDFEECFDEWDLGREDAVDIEAVILLDNSWSMSADIDAAYESMWAIKRALDKINASTTVVTFSHTTELLYDSDQRAEKTVPPRSLGNSTDPYNSLRYARSVLANSKRAIKILIPITDGVWSQAKESDDVIRQLRQGGVLTALGMIGAAERTADDGTKKIVIDSHGCEIVRHITKMDQLFLLARDMVKVGIDRNLSR